VAVQGTGLSNPEECQIALGENEFRNTAPLMPRWVPLSRDALVHRIIRLRCVLSVAKSRTRRIQVRIIVDYVPSIGRRMRCRIIVGRKTN